LQKQEPRVFNSGRNVFVLNGIAYGLGFLNKNKKHQISFSFYLMGFFYFLTVYARGWGVLGLQQLPVK